MKNKRLALAGTALVAAAAVLGNAAPANAAPGGNEAAGMASQAFGGLVGNVHIKVSNYTDHPIEVQKTANNDVLAHLKPGESHYIEGAGGGYLNQTSADIVTKDGEFRVSGRNAWAGWPVMQINNLPGQAKKLERKMAVYNNHHFKHDGVTYALWRNPDGSAKHSRTKNFHIIVD